MNDMGPQPTFGKSVGQALLGLCLLIGASGLLSVLDEKRGSAARLEQLAYLPKGEYLRLAVLGYRQLVADVIWLQAVQHIGASRDTQQGYRWTYHAVDVLTDLDPTFVPPYQATGVFLGVLAGYPDEGVTILDKGIRFNPTFWQLPFLAGYISYYERCDPTAGGQYLRRAAQVPASPAYLPKLAARMTVESGDPAAALEFLDRFSRTVTDERVREALLQRMKEVVQEKDLLFLEESVRRYSSKYGHPPAKLEDLMLHGVIGQLPTDPLGGQYQIDFLTGRVSSSSRQERLRIHQKVACKVETGNFKRPTWSSPTDTLPVLQ
jgi:hypothetical protein